MQIIVTHGSLARSRVLSFPGWQIGAAACFAGLLLLLMSGISYHLVVLKAAREGWPVISHIVKFVVRDETAQRDRVMRENLDAMASRLGEMQAKLVRLESMGERVSGLAGLKAEDFRGLDKAVVPVSGAPRPGAEGGSGGPYIPMRSPSMDQLNAALASLDENADRHADVFTLIESRLLETKLRSLLVPSSAPVEGPIGSGFGFRLDPFTGRGALHTGLDFPAEPGVPILAAAGGVVLSAEMHPAYGRTVEIDHGNGLVTRYAHASKIVVAAGDLIRRGQKIAEVGSSGRSTGPHLHFEVLVEGVPQDPAKFLAQSSAAAGGPMAGNGRALRGSRSATTLAQAPEAVEPRVKRRAATPAATAAVTEPQSTLREHSEAIVSTAPAAPDAAPPEAR
jgi:murein DD-endopeptidase MepM/ murein hydrolase activator NlpD